MQVSFNMIQEFNSRTNCHIQKVYKYCTILYPFMEKHFGRDKADKLIQDAIHHDESKFSDEEKLGYILMTYIYANKLKPDPQDKIEMDKAWNHHKQNNDHHPEFFKNINNMDPVNLAHMVADWAAMGEEFHNSAKNWFKKVNQIKYKFNVNQVKLINQLLNEVEHGTGKTD